MNKIVFYSLIIIVLLLLTSRLSFATKLPNFTALVKTHSAAVVNISTSYKDKDALLRSNAYGDNGDSYRPSDDTETSSLGSGFILSKDGYVVTNYHVIEDAGKVIVRLNDRREFTAQLIGNDIHSDIALLKIDADDLPVLMISPSDQLEVGEWVVAIGSPYGFEHSVAAGIVSAKQRSLPTESYVPFIQTDVAINPGNSGGPLFNIKGEVIGINSQIYSRTGGSVGLSFAIPIDVVMRVVEQLKTKGRVSRGRLGVRVQEVTRAVKKAFKLEKIQGALVNEVFKTSPADGILQIGDIIVEFDGTFVPRVSALPVMVGEAEIGKKIKVMVLRQGKRKQLTLTLTELANRTPIATKKIPKASTNQQVVLGMGLLDLNDAMRKSSKVKAGGAWVEVVRNGVAAHAGILMGDVVLMFDGKPVHNAKQLLADVKAIVKGDSIAVLIKRGNKTRFVVLSVD